MKRTTSSSGGFPTKCYHQNLAGLSFMPSGPISCGCYRYTRHAYKIVRRLGCPLKVELNFVSKKWILEYLTYSFSDYILTQDHWNIEKMVFLNYKDFFFNPKYKLILFAERRNGSPSQSPSEKARRPYAPALEKARLGGSGGSVDSRSESASPDRGTPSARGSFLYRGSSERSSAERLRISTNRDPLRSSKDANDLDKESKDLVDGDVRPDEDNEPPGPAPGSRPTSPANPLSEFLSINYERQPLSTPIQVFLLSPRKYTLPSTHVEGSFLFHAPIYAILYTCVYQLLYIHNSI